ncbi:hypothetical protein KA057_04000 [Candidatus Gracilibacteria bacterium]|nr:hypothetical protein [Candidatus Gracilibacteria bacterium]
MLFRELLTEQEISGLGEQDLLGVLDVPVDQVGLWTRRNVHTTLCIYEHERSLVAPGKFITTCINKRLNLACGHPHSLVVLLTTIQNVIGRVLNRKKEEIVLECGSPVTLFDLAAIKDQTWATILNELRFPGNIFKTATRVTQPTQPQKMLAALDQESIAETWQIAIHRSLSAFEEVVSVLTIDEALSRKKVLN